MIARMRELTERENVEAEDRALRFVARSADGSMRDALSLLDQCMAFYMGETLTYEKALSALGAVDTDVFGELLGEIIAGNAGRAVLIFEKIIERGREVGQFVSDFIWYMRNLLLAATSDEALEAVDASEEQLKVLKEHASRVEPETVMRYIRILSDLLNSMRQASNRRVLTEVAIVRLCRPQMETTDTAFRDRVRALEAYTKNAAYLLWCDDTLGTLKEGKNADVIVFEDDYLNVPDEQLKDVRVRMTMQNGEIVYRNKD